MLASSPLHLTTWVVFKDNTEDLLILGNANRTVDVRLEMGEWELSGGEMSEFARVEEAIDGDEN